MINVKYSNKRWGESPTLHSHHTIKITNMKSIISVLAIISLLASCSGDRSGKREPNYTIVRVKMVNDNSIIDWVRLNSVETRVYRVGDTVRMNLNIHNIATPGTSDITGTNLVILDSIVGK